MNGDRAMRVDGAFRHARGAARVAHRRGCSLVDLAVREVARLGAREQILVLDCALRGRPVPDRDHVLEADALAEVLDERPEHLVRDEHPVTGMRRDVREVVGMEAEVERVRDHPADRDADVGLEVLVVVPAERPDAVAVLQAELVSQRCGEAACPRRKVGVRVAVPALVRKPRDDLAVAEELLAAAEDRRHVQRVVHDQPVHLSLLG